MNYATIKQNDIANGPGVRISLFVSGCRHHCKGCFNAEAWDFNYGEVFDDSVIEKILDMLDHEYVEGLSLLGGEPFEPENQQGLYQLVSRVKEKMPQKNVWCYTGFDFEKDFLTGRFSENQTTRALLSCIDVIVDGKFVEELKDLSLIFRGSSNQRIIDVKESLLQNKVVLLPGVWKRKSGSGDIYET